VSEENRSDPVAEAPAAADRERRTRVAAVVVGMLPALALVAAELWVFGDLRGFPLDDPWIHLRFAERLAEGHGLSYQGAERVAGSTAPLWTALLSILALLPLPLAPLAKLAGLVAHAVGLGLVFKLGRRFGFSPGRASLAVVLVGLADGLVLSAPSGMEVPLFVALSLAGLARHLDERGTGRTASARPPVAFLLFALAALARPEGVLLPLLAALDRAVISSRGGGLRVDRAGLAAAWRGLAVAALVLVPVAVAFVVFSGSPLPTTLAAKSSGPPRFVPELRSLGTVLELMFAAHPLPTLLAAGGAVECARRLGGDRDRGLLLPAWAFALPVASAMLSSGREFLAGNFGRYFFPLLPCVVLLGLIAVGPLDSKRFRSLSIGGLRLPLLAFVVLALVAPPLLRTARIGSLALAARENVERSDRAAALWLAENAPSDALVATVDIGLLGYTLPNPLLDLGGIVHPERQAYFGRLRAERGLDWSRALRLWLDERRPEYVVVFPAWFPLLEAEPGRFPALVRFRIRGNVAMAGDELVVYATPWTRARAR
jgi:hypothetical protein